MKLSHQDAELYFTLMWAVQYFVKERLQLFPEIATLEDYIACSPDDKLQIRQSLFTQRELIDAFVTENPQQVPEQHLQIVRSWKQAVVGEFYIERMLKRYTVFIASDDTVYGVLGLHDDFEDLFHKSQLPRLVKAVLLPFQGQIIYDGLLQGYNVFFGGGIRGDLKEIYLAAKQNGRIVESLDTSTRSAIKTRPSAPRKNWRSELDALADRAKKLRGGGGQPAVNSPTFSLIKASLEFGQVAVADPQDTDQLWRCFEKIERTVRNLEKTLYRMG